MAIEKPGGAPDGEGGSASLYLADANLRRLLGRADPALTRRWEPTLTEFGAWVAAEVDPALTLRAE